MATEYWTGKEVKTIELLDLFPPSAGMITQYYGRIGSGKTYAATQDILDLLRRGKVVYANWHINYQGLDERYSIPYIIRSLIFPWYKRFYAFPKENLRYIEIGKGFYDKFASLTDCHVFLDEGHLVFDSYEMARLDIQKRASILHTRHFDRSIHIISQRPTAVHVAMRANVNVFYRCQCLFAFGPIVRFKRTEFQDLQNETVDESDEKELGVKYYWGSQKVFEAYDTKYLRGDTKASQKVLFRAYDLPYLTRWVYLFRNIFGKNKDGVTMNSWEKQDIKDSSECSEVSSKPSENIESSKHRVEVVAVKSGSPSMEKNLKVSSKSRMRKVKIGVVAV